MFWVWLWSGSLFSSRFLFSSFFFSSFLSFFHSFPLSFPYPPLLDSLVLRKRLSAYAHTGTLLSYKLLHTFITLHTHSSSADLSLSFSLSFSLSLSLSPSPPLSFSFCSPYIQCFPPVFCRHSYSGHRAPHCPLVAVCCETHYDWCVLSQWHLLWMGSLFYLGLQKLATVRQQL